MAVTLPTLTQSIDNAFVTTWYEIRKDAVDNVLNATPVWAALLAAGVFTPQEGGEFITRTVKYGQATRLAVAKGDTFPQGEDELETMARWNWRYTASHVQRSVFDDQKNRGPSKIKSLVGMRLQAARDALEQGFETDIERAVATAEDGKSPQGLNDIIPPVASQCTGTYGGIARPATYSADANGVYQPATGNTFWGAKYMPLTLPIEVNLVTNMRTLYNSIHNNQSPPNLIETTQALFELYEEFAEDKTQIIRDVTTHLANLGFEVLRYKGKPMIWTPGIAAGTMKFLNTDFMEVVYDPGLYFDMTDFKSIPLSGERIAHILVCHNVIATQLRRFGMLYTA